MILAHETEETPRVPAALFIVPDFLSLCLSHVTNRGKGLLFEVDRNTRLLLRRALHETRYSGHGTRSPPCFRWEIFLMKIQRKRRAPLLLASVWNRLE